MNPEITFDEHGLPSAEFDHGGRIYIKKTEDEYEWVQNADGSEQVVRTREGYEVNSENIDIAGISTVVKSEEAALRDWVTSLRSYAAVADEWEPPEGFYED